MGGKLTYRNEILAMHPKDLETFVHRWVSRRTRDYVDHQEFGNAHDLGRDVVGFVTDRRHEGPWDNYQCKMLAKPLDEGMLFEEVGKVLYFASEGGFTPPRRFIFVAPKGFGRSAEAFLNNPSKFQATLSDEWDERCAKRIRQRKVTPMTTALKTTIAAYDFKAIEGIDIDRMLTLPDIGFVLADTFGDDPGEAPAGVVPRDVTSEEAGYIQQLFDVYAGETGHTYASMADIDEASPHRAHIEMQRRRYFDAHAFRRHFRDNLEPHHLDAFNAEVHSAVFDRYTSTSGLHRVNEVMSQAAALNVGGIFGRHQRASTQVRQGTCHHLANEGVMPWNR